MSHRFVARAITQYEIARTKGWTGRRRWHLLWALSSDAFHVHSLEELEDLAAEVERLDDEEPPEEIPV